MKNLIKISLVFMLLLTTVLVEAKEIKKNADRTTTLVLSNVKQGNQVLVKDVDGVVLYKEAIKTSGDYAKKFDLTALPDGNYFFEIVKDFEIKTIPFTVTFTEVTFNKEETAFKPLVRLKENKLFVSQLVLDDSSLEIEIFYANQTTVKDNFELIYSEKIAKEKLIKRIYSLSKDKKGEYKIVLKSQGRVYTENINL